MSTREEWGNATWDFFHVLSLTIRVDKFIEIRPKVISLIYEMCANLPCPDCSQDAKNLLTRSYVRNIRNKADLIEFLRQLHNIINYKFGKPEFSMQKLIEKYHDKNIYHTTNKLIFIYQKKYNVPNLFAHNLKRSLFIKTLKQKIEEIKHGFHY